MASVGFNYLNNNGVSSIDFSAGYSGGVGASDRYTQYGLTAALGTEQYHGFSVNSSGNWVGNFPSLNADTIYYMRAVTADDADVWYGNIHSQKTNANVATAQTPTSSAITSTTATIACDYVPNVNQSTCSAQLQYKKTTDVEWTNAGSPSTTGGTSTTSISRDITGLTQSTQYQVRLVITRTTANDTSLTSSTHSFTTLAGTPSVTTDTPSSVTATTAQLNATVTINAGTSVEVYWKWGTDNPPTQNTTATQSVSGDGSFSVGISGLSSSTTYYTQAFTSFSTPSGSPTNGSVVQFNTAEDPLLDAAEEDHMHIYNFDGQYGVAKTVYFTLSSPAATSSDRLVTTAPGSLFASGDIKVSKDGGAFANVANSVTQIAGSNPLYSLVLSTSEMSAEDIVVQIVDQDGPAFRDAAILVRTKLKLSEVNVDASNLTNTSAMKLTGVGTGSGLELIAGATGYDLKGAIGKQVLRSKTAAGGAGGTITLDASASSTNDYYNGSVILIYGGTGAGQARVITDYVGATQVATVHRAWATAPDNTSLFTILAGDEPWAQSPGAELSAIPTYASAYSAMLQFVFQRFAYKRDQTATLFQMYKVDDSTALGDAAVSDNGTTETHERIT